MSWLSNLGINSPVWLTALPLLAAILAYAYFKRGIGSKIVVPTNFIIKQLSTTTQARKKFVPPVRFFWELLIILIFVLALSGIYYIQPSKTVAILLDNSFSMQRQVSQAGVNISAWNLAKEAARGFIANTDSAYKIEIYLTSPGLHKISAEHSSRAELLSAIENSTVYYGQDLIEQAIERLLLDPNYAKVIAFSDKQAQFKEAEWSSNFEFRSVVQNSNSAIRNNLAINDVRALSANNQKYLEVDLASYSDQLSKAKVSIFSLNKIAEHVERSLVGSKLAVVPKSSNVTVRFEQLPAENLFEIQLEVLAEAGSPITESILEDNLAWVAYSSGAKKILIVSDLTLKDLGLDTFSQANFEYLAAERLDTINSYEAYSAVVFHNHSPSIWPATNSLFINPIDSKLVESKINSSADVSELEITRWEQTHPVLNYINVPSMDLKKANTLKVPEWGLEFISSSNGALAFSGLKDNFKILVLGFEILPYEGKQSALSSILFLNALKYVSSLTLGAGYLPVGAVLDSKTNQAFEYLASDRGSKGLLLSLVPGIVEFLQDQSPSKYLAINYFNQSESNTFSQPPVSIQNTKVAKSSSESFGSTYYWLIYAVLLLLLLELIASAVSLFTRRSKA